MQDEFFKEDVKRNGLISQLLGKILDIEKFIRQHQSVNHSDPTAVQAWPVGSVFTSVVSTNPNTLLGYGTWTAFGAGRTLVGLDAGQTEFDTVEETGGSKTHTLITAEMPSHTHTPQATGAALWLQGASVGLGYVFNADSTNDGNAQFTNTSTGGGGSHNNLQPYIVVYFWKRTA